MSLVQQGIHTARNRKRVAAAYPRMVKSLPTAMVMWNMDAQVLSRTCPACGSPVRGQRYPRRIPAHAIGLTSHHFSMKPR